MHSILHHMIHRAVHHVGMEVIRVITNPHKRDEELRKFQHLIWGHERTSIQRELEKPDQQMRDVERKEHNITSGKDKLQP